MVFYLEKANEITSTLARDDVFRRGNLIKPLSDRAHIAVRLAGLSRAPLDYAWPACPTAAAALESGLSRGAIKIPALGEWTSLKVRPATEEDWSLVQEWALEPAWPDVR